MNLGLKGKRALVTGGATGLGWAVVEALAAEGADIALSYRSSGADTLASTCENLSVCAGVKIVPLQADIGDVDAAERLYTEADEALGGIDVLVNNAGIWLTGTVEDISVEDWDKTMEVNLRAPFLLCQRFVREHRKNGTGGHVVNVTSQAAFHGSTTGHAHYAASKAGLVTFSISMAREVAKDGINVNCVAVGLMRSKMTAEALAKNESYYVNRIPMGRVAEPEELAQIVTFMASERASYMTGTTLDITGGMLMR